MRIMLLTNDRKIARLYMDAADKQRSIRLCTLKNKEQVLERFFRDPFDALLSDDPTVLLPRVQNCSVIWPNYIFLLSAETFGNCLFPETLTFCYTKDSDPFEVLSQIGRFPPGHKDIGNAEVRISRLLQRVGVPVSLSGFDYLKEAIRLLVVQNRAVEVCSVNDLYRIISLEWGESVYVVEHAMRHAIDAAWIRAEVTLLDELFGNTVHSERSAPSNAAFIFRAADQIQLEQQRGSVNYDIG